MAFVFLLGRLSWHNVHLEAGRSGLADDDENSDDDDDNDVGTMYTSSPYLNLGSFCSGGSPSFLA